MSIEFKTPLHVGTPNIGDRTLFLEYVDQMFDRRWLTNHGELVAEFENQLKDYLGVRHCVVMCSGTIALEIATRAMGLTGEVILPALTFVATAHALQWQGITPVFCDIDPETLCLNPAEVEQLISPRTTGILGVHVYGRGCDVHGLQAVADAHQIQLLFDAAHAFGNTLNGKKIGGFGECEVFSFHATKFFNSFEGGVVATNNDALVEKIRLMQNFGFSSWDRVDHIGTNGKMTEVCAAMGLANFQSVDKFRAINQRNRDRYAQRIETIPGLRLVEHCAVEDRSAANAQYVVVEVLEDYPLSRDELMERLHAENILVRRYFWPGCHRMEPYKTLHPHVGSRLPFTEDILERILLFPTGEAISMPIIDRIFARVKQWI